MSSFLNAFDAISSSYPNFPKQGWFWHIRKTFWFFNPPICVPKPKSTYIWLTGRTKNAKAVLSAQIEEKLPNLFNANKLKKNNIYCLSSVLFSDANTLFFDYSLSFFYFKKFISAPSEVFVILLPQILIVFWVLFFIFISFFSQLRARVICFFFLPFGTLVILLIGYLSLSSLETYAKNVYAFDGKQFYKLEDYCLKKTPNMYLVTKDNNSFKNLDAILKFKRSEITPSHLKLMETGDQVKGAELSDMFLYFKRESLVCWTLKNNPYPINWISEDNLNLFLNHPTFRALGSGSSPQLHKKPITHTSVNLIETTQAAAPTQKKNKAGNGRTYERRYLLKAILTTTNICNFFNYDFLLHIIPAAVLSPFIAIIYNPAQSATVNNVRLRPWFPQNEKKTDHQKSYLKKKC